MKKIVALLFLLSSLSFAGGSGSHKLLKVEVTETYFTIYSADGDFNKESCDVGNPIAFKRSDFPNGYDSMLSTALAAHASGKKIIMWFSGCQASPWSGTMPKPTSIVIE